MNTKQFYLDRNKAKQMAKSLGHRVAAGYLRNRGYPCEVARVILFATPFR